MKDLVTEYNNFKLDVKNTILPQFNNAAKSYTLPSKYNLYDYLVYCSDTMKWAIQNNKPQHFQVMKSRYMYMYKKANHKIALVNYKRIVRALRNKRVYDPGFIGALEYWSCGWKYRLWLDIGVKLDIEGWPSFYLVGHDTYAPVGHYFMNYNDYVYISKNKNVNFYKIAKLKRPKGIQDGKKKRI